MEEFTQTINWDMCIVCHSNKKEPLSCPGLSKQANKGIGYYTFLRNIGDFNSLVGCEDQFNISLFGTEDAVRIKTLLDNQAKWHASCRLKYSTLKIQKLKIRLEKQRAVSETDISTNAKPASSDLLPKKRRSDRQPTASTSDSIQRNTTQCMFCQKGKEVGPLHAISEDRTATKIKEAATISQDIPILSTFDLGDIFAQEKHYHRTCYTSYNRAAKVKEDYTLDDNLAFEEVIMHMEEADTDIFILKDLLNMFTEKYKCLSGSTDNLDTHATRFKERLIDHLPHLKATKYGEKILLTFDDSLSSILGRTVNQPADEDTMSLSTASRIVRRDIFKMQSTKPVENESLTSIGSQEDAVPPTLLKLIQLILTGNSPLSSGQQRYQESLTISQLIMTNSLKRMTLHESRHKRYSILKETPLTKYIGTMLYRNTRSQKLVNIMFSLGLSISYRRVLNISDDIHTALQQHYEDEGLMCPIGLQKNTFTIGAVDNIDHNPTSSTSRRSFHGTGISIFQNIETEMEMPCLSRASNSDNHEQKRVVSEYVDVRENIPFVYANPKPVLLSESVLQPDKHTIDMSLQEEQGWLEMIEDSIVSNYELDIMMWSAYHARKQDQQFKPPSVSCMLPLLDASSNSIGTMRHAIDTIMSITEHVNPGQRPVIAQDQPLFRIAKQIQWAWPEKYKRCIFMMGGLHIEMELMRMLGSLLNGSGWVYVFSKSGSFGMGTADSFLKVVHVKKSRYAHEITACCLHALQYQAYEAESEAMTEPLSFTEWHTLKKTDSSHFFFWDLILQLEKLLFASTRAVRENNLDSYIEILKEWIPYMFALDKNNYAKYLSVHLHDLLTLKTESPADFRELADNFTIRKSERPFSSIAIDQAHEMNNESAKGTLNVISLMESPDTLLRWMMSSSVLTSMHTTFEKHVLKQPDIKTSLHLDDSTSKKRQLHKDVTSVYKAFLDIGNPFSGVSHLYDLDTSVEVKPEQDKDLRSLREVGHQQYITFVTSRLSTNDVSFLHPMTLNKLKLMSNKLSKRRGRRAKSMRADYKLFLQMLIASQCRESHLVSFFSHENHAQPPSLSDGNKIRVSKTKSDLVPCLTSNMETSLQHVTNAPQASCILIDGAFMAQYVQPKGKMTYSEYASTRFWHQAIEFGQLHAAIRTDVIFDVYKTPSIKDAARTERGNSCDRHVKPDITVPRNWNECLLNAKNKTEIFTLLANSIPNHNMMLVSTKKEDVVTNSSDKSFLELLSPCTHEEADTRIFLHAKQASEQGHSNICIRSTDTDVIVIAVSLFPYLDLEKLWVAKGIGNKFSYLPIHEIYTSLGPSKASGLLFFHAFTGCDTVSSFCYIGKKTAWQIADSHPDMPDIWETFMQLSSEPEQFNDLPAHIERFVVLLYDKKSDYMDVDIARRSLVSDGRSIDRIPPTKAALLQHTKRAAFQAGHIWSSSLMKVLGSEVPCSWGWQQNQSEYEPLWSLLPEVSKVCRTLKRCGCTKGCKSKRCTCRVAGLPCTELCKCKGEPTRCEGLETPFEIDIQDHDNDEYDDDENDEDDDDGGDKDGTCDGEINAEPMDIYEHTYEQRIQDESVGGTSSVDNIMD